MSKENYGFYVFELYRNSELYGEKSIETNYRDYWFCIKMKSKQIYCSIKFYEGEDVTVTLEYNLGKGLMLPEKRRG